MTVPVAWLGRNSTEDAQDPTLSLPRQLRNARAALPPGWVIVAHFYDVESGRKELRERGNSLAHQQFQIPIPRDGSVADLLDEAQRPDRRFAAVICESIERVARRTYFGTKIEYELEQAGVALCAADEPIVTGPRAKRATPTLTRRVKQAVSEWYVLQMLELSWDGFIEHVSQGWNVGKPPYGYRAEKVPHPVPARRAEGRTKHRLVPDASRAPAVTYVFQLRGLDKLGYDAIADRLNLDPVAYPPPEPTRPDMALHRWSGSAVREILRNPKYTGYQVWNRRATTKGGCYNDPKDWVWSPQPTHEPLVSKELFDVASTVARKRQGSRTTPGRNSHPATRRSYVLRSYVVCEVCDRRMFGKNRHRISYYACQVDPNEHRDKPWFGGHPKSLWVREEVLITSVSRFFATRVFGPDRRTHLGAALEAARLADGPGDRTAKERAALEQAIKAIGERQARLIRTLADGGTDPEREKEFRDAIRREHAALGKQRTELAEQLARLEAPKPEVRSVDSAALLDALPRLDIDLALVPEEIQRRLYDAFGLEVRYSRPREEVTLRVTVPGHLLDGLVAVTRELDPWNKKSGARTEVLAPDHDTRGGQTRHNHRVHSHPLSAPGRIRTCAHGSGENSLIIVHIAPDLRGNRWRTLRRHRLCRACVAHPRIGPR
ncbi:recombinase family protein [Streptomyces violaceusniger]|uniref:recombinase family protein n=1 Tax=Streptomyces violaceusniger TaxID=68280 RepID=UPI001EEF21DF|nr:recombinase family protein [Streptomyces hygroscopicus]